MPKQRITKEMVVNAAFSLARVHGMAAVTVKALAKSLGCSVQPIYSYCESMEGLRKAVAEKARAFVQEAIAQAVDPQDLFRSTGQAYVRLAREEPHLFQLYLFQPRDQVASLADLYARETNPAVPAKIAADLGSSPEAAQALHLHLLIYTIGIGTIFSVTSPGIPQEEIFQQQEEAYRAFLHHCLGGTQP